MMTRTIALFSFGLAAVLFAASQTEAQPGKGGKGPGKGPAAGSDTQKLERDLERLLEQVKQTKADLARAKEAQGGKKGGFEGKGKKGGFEGKDKKGGDFKKKFEPMKEFGKGKGFQGYKGFQGFKGFEGKGPGAKLDPDTIRERYEFYKKLYDELPKSKGKGKGFEGKGKGKKTETTPPAPEPKFKGKGKGGFGGGTPAAPSRSVESRIDALIRELEALRSEVKGSKKK